MNSIMPIEYNYGNIESQREKTEQELQKIALQKNNEELDRICKNICLCIGWILVLILFIWIIILYTIGV